MLELRQIRQLILWRWLAGPKYQRTERERERDVLEFFVILTSLNNVRDESLLLY